MDRTTIKNIIKTALLNSTDAGANVYFSKRSALSQDKNPAIAVFAENENVEIYNSAPRDYLRELDIKIEVLCHSFQDIPTKIDDLCSQVEGVILANETVLDSLRDIILTGVTVSTNEEAETPIGSAEITFKAQYITPHGVDPETLNDYQGSDIEWDMGEDDGNHDAKDKIDQVQ